MDTYQHGISTYLYVDCLVILARRSTLSRSLCTESRPGNKISFAAYCKQSLIRLIWMLNLAYGRTEVLCCEGQEGCTGWNVAVAQLSFLHRLSCFHRWKPTFI